MLDWLFGRKSVMEWEGVTFREGDRVVTRHSEETTMKPSETGHRGEVLMGDGKVGEVVKKSTEGKNLVVVKFRAQKWQEAGRRRHGKEIGEFVELRSFAATIHVDYVCHDPTEPRR